LRAEAALRERAAKSAGSRDAAVTIAFKTPSDAVMSKRCELYWVRFVTAQVNAKDARSENERLLWLEVAEIWLTLARAEHLMSAAPTADSQPFLN
jgi:hypothetical protein